MTALDLLHLATAVLAAAAALLCLVRIARGPSLLDRAIASDVLMACVVVLFAVMAVTWSRADLAPVLVLLAATGFLPPVVIARFVRREAPVERRILSAEEADEQRHDREEDAREAERAEIAESKEANAR